MLITSHAQAIEELQKMVNSLVTAINKMPPGGKRWFYESVLQPMVQAVGKVAER